MKYLIIYLAAVIIDGILEYKWYRSLKEVVENNGENFEYKSRIIKGILSNKYYDNIKSLNKKSDKPLEVKIFKVQTDNEQELLKYFLWLKMLVFCEISCIPGYGTVMKKSEIKRRSRK